MTKMCLISIKNLLGKKDGVRGIVDELNFRKMIGIPNMLPEDICVCVYI